MASLLLPALALMLTNLSAVTRPYSETRPCGAPLGVLPKAHIQSFTTVAGDKRSTSICYRLLVRLPAHALPTAVPLTICLQTVTGTVPKPARSRRKAAAATHPSTAPSHRGSSRVVDLGNQLDRKCASDPPRQLTRKYEQTSAWTQHA